MIKPRIKSRRQCMKTIVGNSITVNKSIEKANNIKAKSKIKFKGGYVK